MVMKLVPSTFQQISGVVIGSIIVSAGVRSTDKEAAVFGGNIGGIIYGEGDYLNPMIFRQLYKFEKIPFGAALNVIFVVSKNDFHTSRILIHLAGTPP